MPNFYRMLEVVLYSLFNFLPYIFITFYPFRKHFRFSKTVTAILVATMIAAQVCISCLSAFTQIPAGLLSVLSTVLYAAFYLTVIMVHIGKTLFTLLILYNVANLIVSISKCIEGFIAYENALQDYSWTFFAIMLAVELLVLIPLFFFIKNTYAVVFESKSSQAIWRYLWLIPATFYFIWYYHLYFGEHGSSLAPDPSHALFLLIVNAGSLLIYYVVVCLVRTQEKNSELAGANHQLAMQNLQYENLRERISEARQAKHDIRHHITVMDGYLASGELDKLKAYLDSYKKTLPDDSSIVFCKHYATNALLLYFAQQAKNHKIDFNIAVADLPENITIPENVLSVVFGNLLENALEAAMEIPDDPYIKVKIKTNLNAILIEIENPFVTDIIRDKNGQYLSTKHSGRGIGLSSVRNIVKQYDGLMEISHENKIFNISVFINLPMSDKH